jgi:hypothetical protein
MTVMAAGVGFLQELEDQIASFLQERYAALERKFSEDNGAMKNQIASLSETITLLQEKFAAQERKHAYDKLSEAKEQGWTWI